MRRALLLLALSTSVLTFDLAAQPTLATDVGFLDVRSGGRQTFLLDAGASAAGQTYVLAGSASGTSPGLPLAGLVVPLNPDLYLDLSLLQPLPFLTGSVGTLDASGRAQAVLQLPAINDPALIGTVLNHAFVVADPAGTVLATSPAVPLELAGNALRITGLRNGDLVGTQTITVRGQLGTELSAAPGLSVTVNGVTASIEASPTGNGDVFVATDVPLTPGANRIVARAAGPGIDESSEVTVSFVSQRTNNVAAFDGLAYLARGSAGLGVLDLETRVVRNVTLPSSMRSVDDVSVADGLLFALDASSPGFLAVFDLADPYQPRLVGGPVGVPVSPFAGVSAAGGRVVVSGGTSLLTVRSYSQATGQLSSGVASIDLGIGQPDVLVSPDGLAAYVSTDFAGFFGGATFGVTVLGLNAPPQLPTIRSRVGMPGAGFTSGVRGPANFPIESVALSSDAFVTAHGAGLTHVDASTGRILSSRNLGAPLVNVDADRDRAFAVGPGGRLIEIDYSSSPAGTLISNRIVLSGAPFTGVAVTDEHIVIAANERGVIVLPR